MSKFITSSGEELTEHESLTFKGDHLLLIGLQPPSEPVRSRFALARLTVTQSGWNPRCLTGRSRAIFS